MDSENKKNYRESAFTASLDEPIQKFITLDKSLYVVCNNSIYEMCDPSSADPDFHYPYAPVTYNKVLDFGLNDKLVSVYIDWIEAILGNSLNIKQDSENHNPHFGLLLNSKELFVTSSCVTSYESDFAQNKTSIAKIMFKIMVLMTKLNEELDSLQQ